MLTVSLGEIILYHFGVGYGDAASFLSNENFLFTRIIVGRSRSDTREFGLHVVLLSATR
jgi:hypothetical protein